MKKIVYLMGGLGNVIYQINLAYYLDHLGYKVSLNSVLIEYNWVTILTNWKVHTGTADNMKFFIDSRLSLVSNPSTSLIYAKVKNRFLGHFFRAYNFGHEFPGEMAARKCDHFFGYFQNTRIIMPHMKVNYQSKIPVTLSPKFLADITNVQNVVLHYRSGDKKSNAAFNTDFLILLSKISFFKLIVVTDCKDNKEIEDIFGSFNYVVHQSGNVIEDFRVIQLARNKVLSRSSFSWWAAEFSCQDATIIQPYPFYSHVNWEEHSDVFRFKYEA